MKLNETFKCESRGQIFFFGSRQAFQTNIYLGEFGLHITVMSCIENALFCVSTCCVFNIKNKIVVIFYPFFGYKVHIG